MGDHFNIPEALLCELSEEYKMSQQEIANYLGVPMNIIQRRMRDLLPPPNESQIRELYEERKMSQKEVAECLGVTRWAVYRSMKEYKIKTRKGGAKGAKHPKWKPEIHEGNIIECACECGEKMEKYNNQGVERMYVHGHYGGNWYPKGHTHSAEALQKMLKSIGASPNKQEKRVQEILIELGTSYIFVGDGKKYVGGRIPDFIDEDKKKIIEFFGSYWHKEEDEAIKRKNI